MKRALASPAARKIRRLESLVEAGRRLNSSLDVDRLLEIIMELARDLLNTERSTLFLVDRETGELRSRIIQEDVEIRIPMTQGIIGHVVATGRAVMTRNAYRLPYFYREMDRATGFMTRTVLCVPLRDSGGAIIGALEVINCKDGIFTSSDRRFLEEIANLAALALEKALMHQTLLAKRRLEEDLAVAWQIQKSLLPQSGPEVPGLDMAMLCRPARHVGGDYYNADLLGDGTLLLVFGDISGKGVAASLVMAELMAVQGFIVSHALRAPGLDGPAMDDDLVTHLPRLLNRFLARGKVSHIFSTFISMIIDKTRSRLSYVNAGSPPPLLVTGRGEVRALNEGDLPLGIVEDAPFKSEALDLSTGDCVVLYSDGVTEAMNEGGDRFGAARLREVLARSCGRPAQEVLDGVVNGVESFAAGAPQSDDLTLMVVRIV
jgi:sigma-B regulation protein RsbU (phosphoserine phosphatase)